MSQQSFPKNTHLSRHGPNNILSRTFLWFRRAVKTQKKQPFDSQQRQEQILVKPSFVGVRIISNEVRSALFDVTYCPRALLMTKRVVCVKRHRRGCTLVP